MEKTQQVKEQALAWFREIATPLSPGKSAVLKGFELAWPHLAGADREAWKAWVKETVARASSGAAHSPEGLWLYVLNDGPGGDLTRPRKVPAGERWKTIDRASTEYREVIREARAASGHPPLAYALRAISEGRTAQEVYQAWEEAGSPAPEDFPYPW